MVVVVVETNCRYAADIAAAEAAEAEAEAEGITE